MPVVDLSHPLEQISERGLLPKCPFPGPVDLPLVSGAFYLCRQKAGIHVRGTLRIGAGPNGIFLRIGGKQHETVKRLCAGAAGARLAFRMRTGFDARDSGSRS